MPAAELGEAFVQRCRKIWWSIYILDRQMSSQMGVPQSIRDDEITCQLTHFPHSPQRTAALKMQIKLARIYADIARSVYGPKGRLRKKFVISIKGLLDDMAMVAEELRNSFPLHSDERFGETFLPWDLDSLFVSTMILVLIRFVDDSLSEDSSAWLNKAFAFLDTMTSNGNKIAEFRCAELRKLEEMLTEYSANRTPQQHPPLQPLAPLPPQQQQPIGQRPRTDGYFMPPDTQSPRTMMNSEAMGMYNAFSDESSGFGDDLTADQILAVAESMDLGTTDWFNTFATMDTYQMVDPQQPPM
ncbi:hypothetical protein SLS60_003068 [Paraconiothyrium brasiliense]|uniref:Xylanolytic transcriptional activator regulatory domain-containing protein n=1 Tax=Paraconiothyrium brasiliense TaxID=300254 RepID=A0ABR3RVK4_9PLEO